MIFYHDNEEESKDSQSRIEYLERQLKRFEKKGKLPECVTACLNLAQNNIRIYQKKNGIANLVRAENYCLANPDFIFKRRQMLAPIDDVNLLIEEIGRIKEFYTDFFNAYEEIQRSNKILYQGQCTIGQPQGDEKLKKGLWIPIPLLGAVMKIRQYIGIFNHIGWVFITDSGLFFLVQPSLINIESQGPASWQQRLRYHCAFPNNLLLKIEWNEIQDVVYDNVIIPGNETVRIMTKENVLDVVILLSDGLNVVNQSIGPHKGLGIKKLTFNLGQNESVLIPDIYSGLQEEFFVYLETRDLLSASSHY